MSTAQHIKSQGLFMAELLISTLFAYAGMVKFTDYNGWVLKLDALPLMAGYSLSLISYGIPICELSIPILLLFKQTKVKAIQLAIALLIVFTGYCLYIVRRSQYVPCPCNGLFDQLSIGQHVFINLAVVGMCWLLLKEKQLFLGTSN
ncbi:MauE/DoxX family redox-associated membrane protein [Larkinella ripae]